MNWKSYQDVLAWQKAIDLAAHIYRYTATFPRNEQYGLALQMRKSAVSVASNIAEGWARKGKDQLLLFLSYAIGSLAELETQLIISISVNLTEQDDDLKEKIIECRKLIYGIIRSMKKKSDV